MTDYANARIPAELREKLQQGQPLMLIARNSGQDAKARKLVAEDLVKAAEVLYSQTGIDVRNDLPSTQSLIAALRAPEAVQRSTDDSKQFQFRKAEITPKAGLLVVLVTGSGRKITEDGDQPVADYLASRINTLRPALVFARRMDRLNRYIYGTSAILQACRARGAWIGSGDCQLNDVNNLQALISLFAATNAEAEADKIPLATRWGMTVNTDQEMVDGRAKYACTGTPPPGLARMALRNRLGTRGQTIMTLDSPAYYPPEDEVLTGRPNVLNGGKPVDQVALVQWALKNLGKPGMTMQSVGQHLADSYFSTDSLRRMHGASASFNGYKPASRALRGIITNLNFYRTGIYIARLGHDELEDIPISGCMPPGGWASDEDIDRIERRLREESQYSKFAKLGFVGVRARVDGHEFVLRTAEKERSPEGPSYKLASVERHAPLKTRIYAHAIPHSALADSIVKALVEQAEQQWIPLPNREDDSKERKQLNVLLKDLADIDRSIDVRRNDIAKRDANGELVLPAMLISQIAQEVETLERNAAVKREEMRALGERIQSPERNDFQSLLRLIASLRNPEDCTYRDFWRSNLLITSIEVTKERRQGLDVRSVSWHGKLLLQEGLAKFELSFNGTNASGAYFQARERADDAISQILDGNGPLDDLPLAQPLMVRGLIAETLGFDRRHFAIGTCPDARLQALGFAIRIRTGQRDDDLAHDYQVPVKLVTRMREVLDQPTLSWFRRSNAAIEAFSRHIAMGNNKMHSGDLPDSVSWAVLTRVWRHGDWARDVTVTRDSVTVRPCLSCKSTKRLVPMIHGMQGLVCWDCGVDAGGVQWDLQYQRYLIGASQLGAYEFTVDKRKSRGTTSRKRSCD